MRFLEMAYCSLQADSYCCHRQSFCTSGTICFGWVSCSPTAPQRVTSPGDGHNSDPCAGAGEHSCSQRTHGVNDAKEKKIKVYAGWPVLAYPPLGLRRHYYPNLLPCSRRVSPLCPLGVLLGGSQCAILVLRTRRNTHNVLKGLCKG